METDQNQTQQDETLNHQVVGDTPTDSQGGLNQNNHEKQQQYASVDRTTEKIFG